MRKTTREQEMRPYNPKDDPYFVPYYRVHTGNFAGGLALVVTVGGAGTIIVRKFGWAGLIGIIAALILAVIVWMLIKRSMIKSATEPGYINRHNMKTRECITPREKKLKERFYNMDCGLCGKTSTVQAINLRRQRCQHCRSKKVKY